MPIPGGIQGQAGCGCGQPGWVVGDPAYSRGLELDEHCGPFQPRPFYHSMSLCDLLGDPQQVAPPQVLPNFPHNSGKLSASTDCHRVLQLRYPQCEEPPLLSLYLH